MGDPEWQWRDRESYADLFTSYYTDDEPESALVVERGGEVAGYLLGCIDSQAARSEAAVFGRLMWSRWVVVRPSTAPFVWRSFADVIRDRLNGHPGPAPVRDHRWPAHLHIDLLSSVRGQGVGGTLLRTWQERLRRLGVPGCHVQTLAENRRAIGAFQSAGFRLMGSAAPAPGLRTPTGDRHHVQVLVWETEPRPAERSAAQPRG